MFKKAKDLALESMLKRIPSPEYSEVSPELISNLIELGWDHQHDQEPRKKIREEIKGLISREATILSRESDIETP